MDVVRESRMWRRDVFTKLCEATTILKSVAYNIDTPTWADRWEALQATMDPFTSKQLSPLFWRKDASLSADEQTPHTVTSQQPDLWPSSAGACSVPDHPSSLSSVPLPFGRSEPAFIADEHEIFIHAFQGMHIQQSTGVEHKHDASAATAEPRFFKEHEANDASEQQGTAANSSFGSGCRPRHRRMDCARRQATEEPLTNRDHTRRGATLPATVGGWNVSFSTNNTPFLPSAGAVDDEAIDTSFDLFQDGPMDRQRRRSRKRHRTSS